MTSGPRISGDTVTISNTNRRKGSNSGSKLVHIGFSVGAVFHVADLVLQDSNQGIYGLRFGHL